MEQDKDKKDVVDEAAEDVKGMAESFKEMKAGLEEKMEDILKAQANLDKAMIRGDEEEKEVGKNYGFLQARKEVAMGKTAKVPLWDEKTTNKFNSWAHMVHAKDYEGITKAFGDNVQDNVSNWTPTEFKAELVRLAYQNSIVLQKCKIVPMSRDKMDLPAPSGNYTAAWVAAGAAMVDSKVTIGKVSLDTAKLYALALVNQEDLDDPAFPLAPFIADQIAEDMGKKIDTEAFQGNASGSDQFDGWEYKTGVEAVVGAVGAPAFATLLTEDNLLEVVGKLDDMELDGAEWYYTRLAWNAVRAIEDGASSKIVRLNENYKYGLLGFPVNLRAQVGTTATALRAAGFFGNMKHIYIGDRMDMRIDTSEHYRFANDQVVFRGLQRLAIAVALPSSIAMIKFGAAS